jgi:hypothetical protein
MEATAGILTSLIIQTATVVMVAKPWVDLEVTVKEMVLVRLSWHSNASPY